VDYVTDVAITLTVRTQNPDVQHQRLPDREQGAPQRSPRNVFNVWQLAGLGEYQPGAADAGDCDGAAAMTMCEEQRMQRDQNRTRSGEQGIAIIMVMFMVMAMSLVGASLTFVSRNETLVEHELSDDDADALCSRIRSGRSDELSAEYLRDADRWCADPIAAYDITQSPVRWNNAAVVLSSDPAVAANYPIAATQDAFAANSAGTLTVGTGTTAYAASATLLSRR
jgi:hypothetical protein